MRFSCESCKAQLQISDEKVRGKRLTVRCRRCGAKIVLVDGAVASPSPQLLERSGGPMRVSPRPEPRRLQSDDESTRAMDSAVLERALQASRADEGAQAGGASLNGAGAQNGAGPATEKMHFPRPAVAAEDVEWYAMVRGKQTGPLTRDELLARADNGEVGPRTYLWREGMDAWQRASDVPDLYGMFPELPPKPVRTPPPAPPPDALSPNTPSYPTPSRVAVVPTTTSDPAVEEETATRAATALEVPPARITPPVVHRSFPSFGSSAPLERGPFTVFFGLMALAAAAIALWIAFAPGGREDSRPAAAPPVAAPPQTAAPEPKGDAVPPVPPAGLTAEQVHRKLDENKPALQGCVDEALRSEPNLKVGKIHVSTTIAPSGAVTAARIDQKTVDESPLGACLKRATRKIVFPQFSGSPFEVDIPIVVTAESR